MLKTAPYTKGYHNTKYTLYKLYSKKDPLHRVN